MNNQLNEASGSAILSLFQTTKAQRATFISSVVENIREGNVKPLDVHLQVKCMEDLIKELKDNAQYKDEVLTEAKKLIGSEKSATYQSAKVEVREAGTKYDFSKCNDNEYISLVAELAKLDVKVKDREKFLKGLPKEGIEVLDKETSELVTIYPPTKSSTTTVVITLK